jgi:hypothetical protein
LEQSEEVHKDALESRCVIFGARGCSKSEQNGGVHMDALESEHVSFLEKEGAQYRRRVVEWDQYTPHSGDELFSKIEQLVRAE